MSLPPSTPRPPSLAGLHPQDTRRPKHHSTHTYRLLILKEQAARHPGRSENFGKVQQRGAIIHRKPVASTPVSYLSHVRFKTLRARLRPRITRSHPLGCRDELYGAPLVAPEQNLRQHFAREPGELPRIGPRRPRSAGSTRQPQATRCGKT
jgi:hypothetical protein